MSGVQVNEATLGSDGKGDSARLQEIGADNGPVNALVIGVLAADGYAIHIRWDTR